MDMPAIVSEYFPGINMQQVNEAVEKYQPAWQIISHTWGHETLQEIMQGQVSVPDEVINQAIVENLGQDGPVQSVKLKSKANGRLEILAKTKKAGRVEFSGTIEDFVHNSQESHVTYKVKERALKDHGLASWFFSRMSLSMAQKLFGKVDLGESLPTNIHGNTITVDCKSALDQSELAKATIKEHRVLDMVEIKSAVPHDGYITFTTSLNIPEDIQRDVLDMILRRGLVD